jgi:hypothetical protein
MSCGNSRSSKCNPCGPSEAAMNEIANKAAYYARIAQYASDGFSQVYLGAKDVAPTTDNENQPLQEGALYFNTVSKILFVWDGTNWLSIYDDEIYLGGFSVAPALNNQGLPLQTGNLYWNTESNNLWAYNGTTWIRTNFNETTPFLSTGSTTARTLANRFADVVNVKDFGADPTGATPSTTAIQNAVNSGKSVFFPEGTYLINAIIALNSTTGGKLTFGANAKIKLGAFTSSASAFDINGNYWTIEGAEIDGSTSSTTAGILNGITIFGDYNVIQNCYIHDIDNPGSFPAMINDGVRINAGNYNKIDKCVLKNLGSAGISVQPFNDEFPLGNILTNNIIENINGGAIAQTQAVETIIHNNRIKNAVTEGISVDNGSSYCIVSNNIVDSCASAGVGGIGSGWKSINNIIIDNIVKNTQGSPTSNYPYGSGIWVQGDKNIVSGNQCFNNNGYGIAVFGGASFTGNIESLTSGGTTTATAVTQWFHFLQTGDSITISGANPAGYNGTVTVTVINKRTFTYTVPGGLPAATGTITFSHSATASQLYSDDNFICNNLVNGNIAGGYVTKAYNTVDTGTYIRRTIISDALGLQGVIDNANTSIISDSTSPIYNTNAGLDVSEFTPHQFSSKMGTTMCGIGTSTFDSNFIGTVRNTVGKNITNGYLRFTSTSNTAGAEQSFGVLSSKPSTGDAYSNAAIIFNFNRTVQFPGIPTTVNAANAFLDTGESNSIKVSSSSIKYKKDIEPIDSQYSDKVLDLQPVWYRSKCEADNSEWSYWGLIAEEVEKIDPRLVNYGYDSEDYELVEINDESGYQKSEWKLKADAVKKPTGVQYDRVPVLLLDVVKKLKKEIEELKNGNTN